MPPIFQPSSARINARCRRPPETGASHHIWKNARRTFRSYIVWSESQQEERYCSGGGGAEKRVRLGLPKSEARTHFRALMVHGIGCDLTTGLHTTYQTEYGEHFVHTLCGVNRNRRRDVWGGWQCNTLCSRQEATLTALFAPPRAGCSPCLGLKMPMIPHYLCIE
jgi:hypothetical protein